MAEPVKPLSEMLTHRGGSRAGITGNEGVENAQRFVRTVTWPGRRGVRQVPVSNASSGSGASRAATGVGAIPRQEASAPARAE